MEAYELLMPAGALKREEASNILPRVAELIQGKKTELKDNSDRVMDDLARDVIKFFRIVSIPAVVKDHRQIRRLEFMNRSKRCV
jgi:hypothetical protein